MPDSSRFGRYEVEEEVARGGMGVIYRVRDPEMRRFLAMKVLLADGTGGTADSESKKSKLSARFVDEAQLTGQLDHPGIIPVYDMGRDDDGQLFFTMRLVKGRTLEEVFELVRKGKEGWTTTRALGVLQKVCEAMAFAHERGVIHRDLKPANVMVGRFGETYVMDWGLAKLVDEEAAPEPPKESGKPEAPELHTVLTSVRKDESSRGGDLATLEGDVMGTPAYMAPEQARGDVHHVGPRADVYSLGAMLYHLLAGHAPYRPAGESASSAQVLERLLAGPPAAIEREAPGAPGELCAICERAMARDPGARYAGMLEVAEDLQAYVENRVVQAYRRGAVVEFRKWVQRNRGIAASLAAVFAIVIAGLVTVSWVQSRARREVEDSNARLRTTNEALETERARTAEARDSAEQNELRARDSERAALASEREALWQSYVGNIGAAYAALEVGSASEARRRLAACPEDLRGWEWRYLDQRADGSLRTLTGSGTFLFALAVNPVKPQVAAGGGMFGDSGAPDYAIRVWNYETGELVQQLDGHRTNVTSLAFSPAGDALASSDSDGNLHIWDVASGNAIADVPRLGSRIDYHPDGRWIAWATLGEGTVCLWDSYELRSVAKREIGVGTNALRFAPDGETLALAGKDHHVRILDLELNTVLDLDASGEALDADRLSGGTGALGPGVYSVDFSPDGSHLVTGSGDGFVRIWNLEAGERERLCRGHTSAVKAVRWHPRFAWIVSSDEAGTIRFWDATTGRPLDVLRGHDEDVNALRFSSLGDRLLSASRDRTVRVWDGQAGANDTILEGWSFPNFRPYELSFAPDGEHVAWRSGQSTFVVTDVRTGEDVCSVWTYDAFSTVHLQFGSDGLWKFDATGRLSCWDTETGAQTASFESGMFARDFELQVGARTALIAGAPKSSARVVPLPVLERIDLPSGEARWSTPLPFQPTAIRTFPDETRCLVQFVSAPPLGDGSWGFACFDISSGELLWRVDGLPRLFGTQVFPDGKRFVYTTYNGWDDALFIRSAETGELLAEHVGHAQPSLLDVSPDGTRVVSGNWDGTMSLWSPERGEILALPAHGMTTARVAFSPDGQTIASLGMDGRRRLWNASPEESRREAHAAAALRRRWSVDARQRVDELLKTRVHRAAVVEALEADPSLRPEQRAAAIFLARSAPFSPEGLMTRCFAITTDPDRSGAEYLAALEGAKHVLELIPDMTGVSASVLADLAPKFASVHEGIAAAQIRLGLPREALASLDRADEELAKGVSWPLSSIHFLRALAHHDLGEADAAAREYDLGLRELKIGSRVTPPEFTDLARTLEVEVRGLLGR